MNIRKINRAVHRDLGYFFFGMCIIYGLSGIALNHRHHWNPNFIITQQAFTIESSPENFSGKALALKILEEIGEERGYKSHLTSGNNMKIFIEGGTVNANFSTGSAFLETIKKRPVFNQVNFLHYNTPKKLWTWFSDAFAVGLILLAISGLFVLKGKNGLAKRGVWFASAGIIIPLVLLYFYLS
jgi:uncharacterized protein